MMVDLARTPLSPAPRTSVVRGPADLRLKYEKMIMRRSFDLRPIYENIILIIMTGPAEF